MINKIPNDASEEAKICLTCDPSRVCKNPLRCERYKEEVAKIKRKYNTVTPKKPKKSNKNLYK